jgi:hypothetical protein
MSLAARKPKRRCNRRYATRYKAEHSKLYLAGGQEAVPCVFGCEGYHLEATPKSAPRVKAAAPKDTGPDRATRATVLSRDGFACCCCGQTVIGQRYSLQHRKRRSQGGGNSPANLLTVLGDGTSGCHARIDSRIDPEDEAKGYTVRSFDDPAAVAVMYFSEGGSGFTAWLAEDGSLLFEDPGVAA